MFLLSFFHGNVLAGIFSSDTSVVAAAADYLKAYAIDCMFTAIFFCYIGFYNGIGMTKFVMFQGIIGAFGVRVPVSYESAPECLIIPDWAGNTYVFYIATDIMRGMYAVSEEGKTGVTGLGTCSDSFQSHVAKRIANI